MFIFYCSMFLLFLNYRNSISIQDNSFSILNITENFKIRQKIFDIPTLMSLLIVNIFSFITKVIRRWANCSVQFLMIRSPISEKLVIPLELCCLELLSNNISQCSRRRLLRLLESICFKQCLAWEKLFFCIYNKHKAKLLSSWFFKSLKNNKIIHKKLESKILLLWNFCGQHIDQLICWIFLKDLALQNDIRKIFKVRSFK